MRKISISAEVHTCLNDARIVENHQGMGRQMLRDIVEDILAYLAMPIEQKLAMISLGYGKLGYPIIGQRIVVVTDSDMSCIHSL